MSILKNRDFTPAIYLRLLKALKFSGYAFQTFAEYVAAPLQRVVILRHDVDRKPRNSLALAGMEVSAYSIPAADGQVRLYSGAFITKEGAEKNQAELNSRGIKSEIVER